MGAKLMQDLEQLGLKEWKAIHRNLTPAALYEQALSRGEVRLARDGAMVALTGAHTGRSPNDKYIVEEPQTAPHIAWGKVNQPISETAFNGILSRMMAHWRGKDVFVQDLAAGADARYRLPIRVITANAWHSAFAQNMFRRPSLLERERQTPQFTVLQAPDFQADPARDGTRSGTFIIIHFARRLVLIGGTSYAGEIKKSIFTVMNYLLPEQGVLPMHCSANVGPDGKAAVFFGLSGTGKTTLSADSTRTLIGDDEHGWSDQSIFNIEGGCYAKVIKLHPEAEAEIWQASQRFGTVLENVVMDERTRQIDFDDARHTENTRSSYPLEFIPNASETGIAPTPAHIVMLTADAFGVLPPLSRLTADQAMYHYLSGYTARVAGTEKGLTEPTATFSACFGGPFLPRSPVFYARMLGEKMARQGARCWLLNTGWAGGTATSGAQRMPIAVTRALLRAALSGSLENVAFRQDPAFGLMVPASCPGVPEGLLQPREQWADKEAYDRMAAEVVQKFAANFMQFAGEVDERIAEAGIRRAA